MSDDEVDENGNPLTDEDAETPANDDASQVPIEASIESSEATDAEADGGNETETK